MMLRFCLTENVKLWRDKGWRYQNGLNAVFDFKFKLILFETALEEEYNSENRFRLRHIKPELWDFKEIWLHPPEPYFSLKNDPSDIFFTVFAK